MTVKLIILIMHIVNRSIGNYVETVTFSKLMIVSNPLFSPSVKLLNSDNHS